MTQKKHHLNLKKKTPPPVARFIGFRLVSAGKGKATLRLPVRKQHENFNGSLHGGIICDVADAAMGLAFISLLPSGESGVTVELKINFLKPTYRGDVLDAKAYVISHGRSLYYIECEVWNDKKRLIAKAASTCKVIRRAGHAKA